MAVISLIDHGLKPCIANSKVFTPGVWASGDDLDAMYRFYVGSGNYCKRVQLLFSAISQFRDSAPKAPDFIDSFMGCYASARAMVYMIQFGVLGHKNRKYAPLFTESWTFDKALRNRKSFIEMGTKLTEAIVERRPLFLEAMDPAWWLMVRSAMLGRAGAGESDILAPFYLFAKPALIKANRGYYRLLCLETYKGFFTDECCEKSLGGPSQEFYF